MARNPKASVDILKTLLGDVNWMVRLAAVENPNTPTDILQQFADDPRRDVREAIQERLGGQ